MQKPLDPMSVQKAETPSASYVLRRRYGPARFVIAGVSWLTVISMLLQPVAAFADPATGFKRDDAGSYDYNDTANWVDITGDGSGDINDIWDYSLQLVPLPGQEPDPNSGYYNQTVTFGANTMLGHGWTFNHNPYDADYNFTTLTLKSDGSADRTVTLGGNISIDPRGLYWPAVYIGSQTTGENLTVDLGGATRTFAGYGSLLFENAITGGAHGITLNGAGLSVVFRGANTYTGATTVNGSLLSLDYGYSNTSKLSDTAALILGGAYVGLSDSQVSGADHAEVVGSTTINAGASYVTLSDGQFVTLNMKTITRNPGGTLLITHASRALTDNTNTSGILGGWAVVIDTTRNQGDWAVNSTDAADGPITNYTGYTDIPAGNWAGDGGTPDTNNSRILTGTSVTLTGDRVTNSLKIESGIANKSLALGANKLTLTSGGILQTAQPGGQNWQTGFTISGNEGVTGLTAGADSGYDLIIHSYNHSGGLTISAVIGDNGANPVSLTKSGSGTLILASDRTQTYTGQTYLNGGDVQVDGTLSAGGAVNVNYDPYKPTLLCGSGTINRPVVLNDRAVIKGGPAGPYATGTLTLGSDLTVPQGAIAAQSSYTNNTIKIGGTATINGTITYPVFEMQSGSTLKGTGTLFVDTSGGTTPTLVTLKSGATLRPGGSIGKLTASGVDISLETASIVAWEAKGYVNDGGTGTAGTDYSQLVVNGGAKFTIAEGTQLQLHFPAEVNFGGTFWNNNRTWDIITGGSGDSSGSIADGDISVSVAGSPYDGGDRTITGQGAFSIAYVADGILRLTWTTEYYQWKQLYFTAEELEDPLVSGDDADPDGDRMTNLEEFLAGTDPRDSDSCLVLSSVEPRDDGVVVSWSSELNRFYRIEMATNLVVGFDHTVKTNIAAVPPVNVYTDSPPAEAGSRFYRVRLE